MVTTSTIPNVPSLRLPQACVGQDLMGPAWGSLGMIVGALMGNPWALPGPSQGSDEPGRNWCPWVLTGAFWAMP